MPTPPRSASCLDEETLARFASGDLSEAAVRAVDEHVADCAECAGIIAMFAETLTPSKLATPEFASADTLADGDRKPWENWKRGATIGRYVLRELVGRGGMGVVYAATDTLLERTVALKLIERRGTDSIVAEARLMAQLSHPNIVAVYDAGVHEDVVFIAMELVVGVTLRAWSREETRNPRDVVRVFREAGRGLAAAHAAGFVHRDFKPDNVLIGDDGRVFVSDFGLAHSSGMHDATVSGTPAYMPPAQRSGEPATALSDQFSFCASLHESLYGERPTIDEDRVTLAPASKAKAPLYVRRILERGLAISPERRFASMAALLEALAHDPRVFWRRLVVLASVVVAFGAGIAVYHGSVRRERACADAVAAQLDGVWDSSKKKAIHDAFARSGAPRADAVWQSVDRTLDSYATAWTTMHVEACDATYVHHAESPERLARQTACLSERLSELRAMTSVFAMADKEIVQNALPAAHALVPVSSCESARPQVAFEAPAPAQAAKTKELFGDLAKVKVLRESGKLADAKALGVRVVDDAARLGYRPLEALALLQLGDAQVAAGEAEAADATLERAIRSADAARDDATRARALTRQLYAVGYLLRQFDRAHAIDARVVTVIERLGGDDELEGDRLQALGMIFLGERKAVEARDPFSRAVALRVRVFGEKNRRVAMSRNSLCLALMERSEWEPALAQCQLALDDWTDTLGPDHPDSALAWNNVGRILFELGRKEDGCRDIERAVAIGEETLPRDHPHLAYALANLGDCRAASGDAHGALEMHQRALAIFVAKFGDEDPKTVRAYSDVGHAYESLGDAASAKVMFDRARRFASP